MAVASATDFGSGRRWAISDPVVQERLAPRSDRRAQSSARLPPLAPAVGATACAGPPISTATPTSPITTPSATSGRGALLRRKTHGSSTVQSGPDARISAVSPDGTHCSAQQTVPLPPASINPPTTVAAPQARHPGAGAPRSRSTA